MGKKLKVLARDVWIRDTGALSDDCLVRLPGASPGRISLFCSQYHCKFFVEQVIQRAAKIPRGFFFGRLD